MKERLQLNISKITYLFGVAVSGIKQTGTDLKKNTNWLSAFLVASVLIVGLLSIDVLANEDSDPIFEPNDCTSGCTFSDSRCFSHLSCQMKEQ